MLFSEESTVDAAQQCGETGYQQYQCNGPAEKTAPLEVQHLHRLRKGLFADLAEHIAAAPTALPAWPFWVIGYPSNAVGALSGAPGMLNKIAVMAPPYTPVQ